MIETVFTWLFKYRPLLFDRGEIVLATSWPFWLAAVITLAIGLPLAFSYVHARGKSARRDRAVLLALRLVTAAVLFVMLLRPVLVLATVVPQQNYLGILVDDSRSMSIADQNGAPRGDAIADILAADSPVLTSLADRFKLRFFRFSDGVQQFRDPRELDFSGTRTELGTALDRTRQALQSVPLAGLVVLTDGADNAQERITESILALQAQRIPVYAVGLGQERFDRDLEIQRVETPRTVLQGSSLSVDVLVVQRGYRGRTVQLNVEDDGRIVSTQDVDLPTDGEAITVRAHFTAEEAGARLFRFVVPPEPGEVVTENNVQEALIVVEDGRQKVLYFEGEPRFEVGFLRRAVADDENIQVSVLLRTAEGKFSRFDVDDSTELAGGFPRTREELFTYRGVILGSIEASFFTHDQLQMLADFVSQRGGGLLLLGGRHAFAEGGYARTPLEDVFPTLLEDPDTSFFQEVQPALTQAGIGHAVTQLADTPDASAERWASLPALSVVNRIERVKPGASRLATGVGDAGTDLVVLAHHRYGRGKVIAFPVQDSWIWQMHADIPPDDLTHETLWRQLLRWLVSFVPDQVSVAAATDLAEPGRALDLHAEVDDETFLRVNNTDVIATVTAPSGMETVTRLDWIVDRDGEYRGSFVPSEAGLHEIRVSAAQGGELIGTDVGYMQATDLPTEFYGAEMQASLLRRLADETGGRFYTRDRVSTLAEDISFTESGATVVEQRELWDMPIFLLLILASVGAEWAYRRRRGLA